MSIYSKVKRKTRGFNTIVLFVFSAFCCPHERANKTLCDGATKSESQLVGTRRPSTKIPRIPDIAGGWAALPAEGVMNQRTLKHVMGTRTSVVRGQEPRS